MFRPPSPSTLRHSASRASPTDTPASQTEVEEAHLFKSLHPQCGAQGQACGKLSASVCRMNEGMNEPLILRARWHLQDNVTSENWRVAWNGVIVWEKGRLPLRENKGIQHSSSQRGHQDLETEGDGGRPGGTDPRSSPALSNTFNCARRKEWHHYLIQNTITTIDGSCRRTSPLQRI